MPSTIVNSIQDSAPLVSSRAVGSHRSPTFSNPAQSLPVPPASLAVGSNRPLSPGNRITSSPNGEKPKQFPTPSSFGINIGPGVWSPLANAAGNAHPEPAGGGKTQASGNGSVCIQYYLIIDDAEKDGGCTFKHNALPPFISSNNSRNSWNALLFTTEFQVKPGWTGL